MKTIELTQGKVAYVDDEDYEWLSQWKWYCMTVRGGGRYAVRRARASETEPGKAILIHRAIMKPGAKDVVDHIDGSGLNCWKSNMRICTQSKNTFNRAVRSQSLSGYKGVSWNSATGRWYVQIAARPKRINLGYFIDKFDAALAYNEAALKYHGEFARLNELRWEPADVAELLPA